MKATARLRREIEHRRAVVGIVGQGYVGLTLACAAAEARFSVNAIDIDEHRIRRLGEGALAVPGVHEADFRRGIETGRIQFTTSHEALAAADIILVCVPTPLRDSVPDLSYVQAACGEIASRLTPGRLVVLESTTYPGTTDGLVRPLLETSGLNAGTDFLLAYSPERIDPGNPEWGLRNTPKVVGGLTAEATGIAATFYGTMVDKVIVVSSCRMAELAKLLENTFRHVNIALANELAMLCHETGDDVWELVAAAATKPFGFMAFYPGPGVGGHCIPLDPTYLAWQVRRDVGHQFRILEQAQDINAQMPSYVSARIGELLNESGKAVKGARVLILGVSYKPDVGDIRESPALRVMSSLIARGAKVMYHDPYVPDLNLNGKFMARSRLDQRSLDLADCVAILTPHSAYDLAWIADHAKVVFDARDAFGPARLPNVVPL
ncbi:MAG: nucleotide sugar dehydrogenase [Actinomycetota bacterium]